jgi:hypothetical protein
MTDIISQAKAHFTVATEQIAHALATTPDERIHWSPSPTARTPLQQVAHAGMAIPGIQGMLEGKPFPYSSVSELDAVSRKAEKEFATREQVLSLLQQSKTEYLAWLDSVTPEMLSATLQLPFGTSMPMEVGIMIPSQHTLFHAAQINYIQTIYGDHDWHLER